MHLPEVAVIVHPLCTLRRAVLVQASYICCSGFRLFLLSRFMRVLVRAINTVERLVEASGKEHNASLAANAAEPSFHQLKLSDLAGNARAPRTN